MGNSGSFLTRNVLRFSGRDWGKTKTKVEVSWLPSYCIHAVWGTRTFLTCGTMTSPEDRGPRWRFHDRMRLGHDPASRAIAAGCWALQSPSPAGTIQEPTRIHVTSQGGTHVFARIPTSVYRFQSNWKDFCSSWWSHQSFSVPGSVDFSEVGSRGSEGCPGAGSDAELLPEGARYAHRPRSRGLATRPPEA